MSFYGTSSHREKHFGGRGFFDVLQIAYLSLDELLPWKKLRSRMEMLKLRKILKEREVKSCNSELRPGEGGFYCGGSLPAGI